MEHGEIRLSEGGLYSFRVIGPCCRLFDREELPWPCSRLVWRSKEPSWRRIGSRFVADMAARRPGSKSTKTVLTLFSNRFTPQMQEWWYSRHPSSKQESNLVPQSAN